MFSRGGESDYNLVLIDGVRVNQNGGCVRLRPHQRQRNRSRRSRARCAVGAVGLGRDGVGRAGVHEAGRSDGAASRCRLNRRRHVQDLPRRRAPDRRGARARRLLGRRPHVGRPTARSRTFFRRTTRSSRTASTPPPARRSARAPPCAAACATRAAQGHGVGAITFGVARYRHGATTRRTCRGTSTCRTRSARATPAPPRSTNSGYESLSAGHRQRSAVRHVRDSRRHAERALPERDAARSPDHAGRVQPAVAQRARRRVRISSSPRRRPSTSRLRASKDELRRPGVPVSGRFHVGQRAAAERGYDWEREIRPAQTTPAVLPSWP